MRQHTILTAASSIGLVQGLQSFHFSVPNGLSFAGPPFYWPAIGHTIACSEENGWGPGYTSIRMPVSGVDEATYDVSCGQSTANQLNNQFGEDFKAAFMDWGSVCAEDSDDDGQTNGEELGDPNCVWVYGQTPCRYSIESLSLPGDPTSVVAVVNTTCEDPAGYVPYVPGVTQPVDVDEPEEPDNSGDNDGDDDSFALGASIGVSVLAIGAAMFV